MAELTTTKEKPIIFSGPMVQAILSGSKTQTRRVVKPQPEIECPDERIGWAAWNESWSTHDTRGDDPHVVDEWMCPYGYRGCHLWVRETWRPIKEQAGTGMYLGTVCDIVEYKANEREYLKCKVIHPCGQDDPGFSEYWWSRRGGCGPWKSPRYMPRWASRITLEVTGVRVDRLQEISEADAKAEGMDGGCHFCGEEERHCCCAEPQPDYRESFIRTWNEINASRGYTWDSNPWVWVVEFRRIENG